MTDTDKKEAIELGQIIKKLKAKKRTFLIMWPIVFALSVLWILPQPRYYTCSVALAPEAGGSDAVGGLASLASNFGFDLGGSSADAIYPDLYPDLMASKDFAIGMLGVRVKTNDGEVDTTYYQYLLKHQKKNVLTYPFMKATSKILKLFKEKPAGKPNPDGKINPFQLSEIEDELVDKVNASILCSVNQRNGVITITVEDQDPLVCAIIANAACAHLQDFIIDYRTSKARIDVDHYQSLTDSAFVEYDRASARYAAYCDANQDIMLQSQLTERDKLESDMQLKYNTYTAMSTQLEMTKARLQERTPAFTTLSSASVPLKPAGPKRMMFVLMMLVLSTFVATIVFLKDDLGKLLKFYNVEKQ